jgi:hypothetical protein
MSVQVSPQWIAMPHRPPSARRDGRRLCIIVPYRDRAEHLKVLMSAFESCFLRAEAGIDQQLPRIFIVEQSGSGPFNRGKLCNVGFDLNRRLCDYVCFHDVDFVPADADYSFPLLPARVCSEGSRHREDLRFAFGGVVAFSVADFERVNGYSNQYSGWGYEDSDLLLRVVRTGMRLESRPGRFLSLPHAPTERDPDGLVRPETRRNQQRFLQRLTGSEPFWDDDGLRSLVYTVERRQRRARNGIVSLDVQHVVVRIDD